MLAVLGAEKVHVGVVDEVAGAIEPGHPHQHRRLVRDPPESRLALLERALGDALLGDVLDDADEAGHRPAGSGPRHIFGLRDQASARRMVEVGDEELPFSGKRGLDHRPPVLERLVADDFAHGQPDQLAARPVEPLGERLVDELEAQAGIEIAGHHRKQVGERDEPGPGKHLAREVGRERLRHELVERQLGGRRRRSLERAGVQ